MGADANHTFIAVRTSCDTFLALHNVMTAIVVDGTAGFGSSDFSHMAKRRQLISDPTGTDFQQYTDPPLLSALFLSKSSDSGVIAFLSYVTKYMQLHNMALPINFAPDHPVEETGR